MIMMEGASGDGCACFLTSSLLPVPWLFSADQTACPSFSAHPQADPVESERERYSHRLYKYKNTHLQCISSAIIVG